MNSLQLGNSDPFDSMTVRLTPKTSEMLLTWLSHLKSNPLSATSWITESEVRQDLYLGHDAHGKSLLFLCSAVLYSRHQHRTDLYIQMLETKRECLQLLTTKRTANMARDHAFILVLSYLFIAEMFLNHVEEARCHVRQLHLLMTELRKEGLRTADSDLPVVCRMHHYDFRCAIMHVRPPTLSGGNMIASLGKSSGTTYVPRTIPPLQPRQSTIQYTSVIQPPAFSEALATLFSQLQKHIDTQTTNPTADDIPWTCEGTSLFFSHLTTSRSHLAAYHPQNDPTPSLTQHWRVEILLSLCGLAILGAEVAGPVIAPLGQRIGRVFDAIRAELELQLCLSSPLPPPHQQAHLWALYLGATFETQCGAASTWFTPRLHHIFRSISQSGCPTLDAALSLDVHLGHAIDLAAPLHLDPDVRFWERLRRNADRFCRVPRVHRVGKPWYLGMGGGAEIWG
jgi:hypothetical protein